MRKRKKQLSQLEKIALARELYLKSGGSRTMDDIGKQVGLSRQTVAKYRRLESWNLELEVVREASKTKAVDLVSDKVVKAYDRHLSNLEALDRRIETLLAEEKLNPTAVAQLARAASTIVQTTRLLNGESTSNAAVDARITPGRAKPAPTPGETPMGKAVDYIMRTGHREGQRLLAQMAQNRQKILSLPDEG